DWLGNSKSEKAHSSFGQDRSGHSQRSLNDQRLNRIRQDVSEEDSPIARSERASGGDEVVFPDLQYLRSHHARVANPTDRRQGYDQVLDARSEKRDHSDRKQDPRKGQEDVEEKTRDQTIGPAAGVARHRSNDDSNYRRHRYDRQTNK